MNSNPFPASFLNFKGQFQLTRVYIPGNQTFMVSPAPRHLAFRTLFCACQKTPKTCGHKCIPTQSVTYLQGLAQEEGWSRLQDWRMDLLTEVHAVEYMKDSMNGIMRVGLLSRSLPQRQSVQQN